ncbi:MAG: hypothetical protein OXC01_17210 [Immundisolibacterales bacterium]|nr:hypothetical protein [Immundisolibacterales bacterium]
MKQTATLAVRSNIGDAGSPGLARRVNAGLPFGIAVSVLAVVLGAAGAARAENECGRPEAGTPIVCSTSNYDAATNGNIVYRLSEANEGDFTLRLTEDLSIRYDRHDPDDDLRFFPVDGEPLYSAVRIDTDADYAGDISFFSAADVASNGRGTSVGHYGKSGALRTEIAGGSFSIESDWRNAVAIHSYRGDGHETNDEVRGDHDIVVRDVVVDLDDGAWAGILGFQGGGGYLNVAVEDTSIKVDADHATGVFGAHLGAGDVDIEVRDVDMEVRGSGAVDGFYGLHLGTGDTDIAVRDVDIEVRGDQQSNGISYVYWGQDAAGNLTIDARDVDIEVHGERYLDGIFGSHRGTGDIDVDVRRAALATFGTDSGGMSFVHDGDGGIDIAARDVDIEVHGDRSTGIGGGQRYRGTGDIAIDVRDSTVKATGESVAGIRSFHMSGEGAIHVRVDGGTITAQGPDSSGILVGLTGRVFGDRTGPIKAPAGADVEVDGNVPGGSSGADGYRAHGVFVNGRVRGGKGVGAGVRLYGGGRVEIGPRGSVGASSGVAVRAEGDGAALYVGVELDGRRPGEAIAGEIRNDDGRTTVAVNGVVLHDAMAGATGARAPNGIRDVSLAASETVAGRAFMPAEFVTSYAPRAAVYEALPGLMLRLDDGRTAGKRLRKPGSPAWVRVSGGQGSYEPDRSHVGAAYDFGRFEAEAGVDFALAREENVTGWASLRHVRGSADVSAPTGGGRVEAAGFGASFGASWENVAGYHASGHFSVLRYDTDLRADGRGLLKEGAGATVRTLGVEAGRRFSLADGISLMPRAWLTRSDVSMDGVRDAVGSRISLRKAARSIVGLGVDTETALSWDGGERKLDLRGRLGVERVLGDAETVADVSGEQLGSEAARSRVVLGLGAAYRWNRWSLGGEVFASGPGSDDSGFAATLRLGMQF